MQPQAQPQPHVQNPLATCAKASSVVGVGGLVLIVCVIITRQHDASKPSPAPAGRVEYSLRSGPTSNKEIWTTDELERRQLLCTPADSSDDLDDNPMPTIVSCPVIVNDDLHVCAGCDLLIECGCGVFVDANVSMRVYGSLRTSRDCPDPVTIQNLTARARTSFGYSSSKPPGPWRSLHSTERNRSCSTCRSKGAAAQDRRCCSSRAQRLASGVRVLGSKSSGIAVLGGALDAVGSTFRSTLRTAWS